MSKIEVVGGCYHEVVIEPAERRLCGSGMRAAALLNSLGQISLLHTLIDDESRAELEGVAAGYGVEIDTETRRTAIEFRYSTPLAVPSQSVAPTSGVAPSVDCDAAVAFGMVEGAWRIRAAMAVVDPQHSTLELSGLTQSAVGRLTLILN